MSNAKAVIHETSEGFKVEFFLTSGTVYLTRTFKYMTLDEVKERCIKLNHTPQIANPSHADEDNAILRKPQPKSGGNYGGIEI